jgi:Na+/H+-translocating membrane pyrophosphatase
MKTKQFWNYLGVVLIISLALGILIHFSSIMQGFGLISDDTGVTPRNLRPGSVISQVLISSLVAFLTFIINYFIIRPLDSSRHLNVKRILVAIILTIVSVTVLTEVLCGLKHLIFKEPDTNAFNLIHSFRDFLIVTIVITGIIIIKNIYDKQAREPSRHRSFSTRPALRSVATEGSRLRTLRVYIQSPSNTSCRGTVFSLYRSTGCCSRVRGSTARLTLVGLPVSLLRCGCWLPTCPGWS